MGGSRPLVMIYLPYAFVYQCGNVSLILLPFEPILLYTGHTPVRNDILGVNPVKNVTEGIEPALLTKT
jgi:hypothetical protein